VQRSDLGTVCRVTRQNHRVNVTLSERTQFCDLYSLIIPHQINSRALYQIRHHALECDQARTGLYLRKCFKLVPQYLAETVLYNDVLYKNRFFLNSSICIVSGFCAAALLVLLVWSITWIYKFLLLFLGATPAVVFVGVATAAIG
jgi:hypothetical protein